MSTQSTLLKKPSRLAAFWLSGWTMLLIVLLSAAPTGGPPRTQLVGSAFDPATTSVATSPRRPKVDIAVKKTDRSQPTRLILRTPPSLAATARDLVLRPLPAAARQSVYAATMRPAAAPNALALSRAARAPPLA